MMKTMHIEAVHRLLRCDWLPLLEPYDLETFSTEYQPVGQDEAEYDFRDFRFAKLERARRYSQPNQALSSEALLEFRERESDDEIVGGDVRGVSDVRSRPEERVSDVRGDRGERYDRFDRDRFERGYERDPRLDRPDLRLERPDPRDPRDPRDRMERYDRPSDMRDSRDPRDHREIRDIDPRDRPPSSSHGGFTRPSPPPPPPPEPIPGGMSYLPLPPAVPISQPADSDAHPWLALFDPTAGQQGLDDLSWMFSLGAVGVNAAGPAAPVAVGVGGVGNGGMFPMNGGPVTGPPGPPGPPTTEFWKQVM